MENQIYTSWHFTYPYPLTTMIYIFQIFFVLSEYFFRPSNFKLLFTGHNVIHRFIKRKQFSLEKHRENNSLDEIYEKWIQRYSSPRTTMEMMKKDANKNQSMEISNSVQLFLIILKIHVWSRFSINWTLAFVALARKFLVLGLDKLFHDNS